MWDALRLDVRHSFRSLRRAPTFSVIVIVTLTVAVGATTAVGSLLNALVLRTVAVPSPEQLVALSALDPRANVSGYFYAETFRPTAGPAILRADVDVRRGGLARVETRAGVFERHGTVVADYFEWSARVPRRGGCSPNQTTPCVISESFRRPLGDGRRREWSSQRRPATVIGVTGGFEGLQAGALRHHAIRADAIGHDGPSGRFVETRGGRLAAAVHRSGRAECSRVAAIQLATQPSPA